MSNTTNTYDAGWYSPTKTVFIAECAIALGSVLFFSIFEVVRKVACYLWKKKKEKEEKSTFPMMQFLCWDGILFDGNQGKLLLGVIMLLIFRTVMLFFFWGADIYINVDFSTKLFYGETPLFIYNYVHISSFCHTLFSIYYTISFIITIVFLFYNLVVKFHKERLLTFEKIILSPLHYVNLLFYQLSITMAACVTLFFWLYYLISDEDIPMTPATFIQNGVPFALLLTEYFLLPRMTFYLPHVCLPVGFSFLYIMFATYLVKNFKVPEFPYQDILSMYNGVEVNTLAVVAHILSGFLAGGIFLVLWGVSYFKMFISSKICTCGYVETGEGLSEKTDEEMQKLIESEKRDIKIVMVGDGAVGKTCLLVVYQSEDHHFPEDYIPTIFDNYKVTLNKDLFDKGEEDEYTLSLWDTAGQEDYDHLRSLSYTDADVFILCFSVVNPTSMKNINGKWAPELKTHAPDAKLLIVGTKTDLREDETVYGELRKKKQYPSTFEDGEKLAKELETFYCECSAKNNDGVTTVFEHAVRLFLNEQKAVKIGRSYRPE